MQHADTATSGATHPFDAPDTEVQVPTSTNQIPIAFTGSGSEYFRIWIVNLLLTIVTLGIYSAWAKVRTERYFYGNTRLAGASFEYLAEPLNILKGRLIAYAFVLALGISAKFEVFVLLIPLYLLLLVGFPWLINLGLRFRARYSAWRGLRFRFDGSVGDAYVNFMALPVLSLFTLNLLIPWVRMKQQDYMASHHHFGGKRFSFHGEAGGYYLPFLIAIGAVIGLSIAFALLMAGTLAASGSAPQSQQAVMRLMIPAMVLLYGGMFVISIYVQTRWLNLLWRNTRLGEHRLESNLRVRDMLWLYFSNAVAILGTLGLAVPWAMVRMARYRASCFALVAHGSLDQFVAEAGGERSAAGAELIDALDLDLDIGL